MLVDILQSFAILCLALALIIHICQSRHRSIRDDVLSAERFQSLFESNSFDRRK